jgi:formylglycine-generating enzyme required for sulfatase activity
MKCPICETQCKDTSRLCQTCGWEFKRYISDISPAEQEIFNQQLLIFQRNQKKMSQLQNENRKLKLRLKKLIQNPSIIPQKLKHPPSTDSKEFPNLKRDQFETQQEFETRIQNSGTFQVGTARFKEPYDINTGIFPIEIEWKKWTKEHFDIQFSASWIVAQRYTAKSLYETSSTWPVKGNCSLLEKKVVMDLQLQTLKQAFPIQMEWIINNDWIEPITKMEFIFVKGGNFEMGDQFGDGYSYEQPVHRVTLDDFLIGKYPVTQGQWVRVMGKNPANFHKGNNYPVECVSWDDTQTFISKLIKMTPGISLRLPTEAEWEYAARSGGKKEKYAGGNEIDKLAWFDKNSDKTTHPVGQKKANGLGLYDMCGNVWEWCEDLHNDNAYQNHASHDPVCTDNSSGLRVLRGGSWYDDARDCRAALRGRDAPGNRDDLAGFRLVFSPRSVSGQMKAK